jgi:hypothetical protein
MNTDFASIGYRKSYKTRGVGQSYPGAFLEFNRACVHLIVRVCIAVGNSRVSGALLTMELTMFKGRALKVGCA